MYPTTAVGDGRTNHRLDCACMLQLIHICINSKPVCSTYCICCEYRFLVLFLYHPALTEGRTYLCTRACIDQTWKTRADLWPHGGFWSFRELIYDLIKANGALRLLQSSVFPPLTLAVYDDRWLTLHPVQVFVVGSEARNTRQDGQRGRGGAGVQTLDWQVCGVLVCQTSQVCQLSLESREDEMNDFRSKETGRRGQRN